MKRLRLIFLLASLAACHTLVAQTNMMGTNNIAHNKQFNWKHVSTEFFDLHYSTDDPVMAGIAGKYAEEALWEICRSFDYKNRSRFALYIFLNPNDYVHSNMLAIPNEKDNGLTPLRNNAAHVIFPGNYHDFRDQIRAKVIRLLMEDYYFGGPIQLSIQNTLLLHLPDWYAEGFPEYVGEGWDYEDDFWLASLENSPMLTFALEGDAPVNRTARKSIWYFISQHYGSEKLGEIFYMTRLTRSVEDGIIHVLGITLKTLAEKWREFVLQRITDNANFRETIEKESVRARLGADAQVLGFALHPSKAKAAIYLNRDGKQKVILYDFDNHKVQETPIVGGFRTEQFGQMRFEMPMAWSPDGNQLVTVVYDDEGEYLAWYDQQKGSVKFTSFHRTLDAIFQIAWNPDGNQLVCSGLRKGQVDLFSFKSKSADFVQLSNDFQDDLFPVWSADGERIYFASTGKAGARKSDDPIRYDANEAHRDIWAHDMKDGSNTQITHSPLLDEYPVGMLSSYELLISSNQTGLYNLQSVNVFLGDTTNQTNMAPGIFRAGLSDSLLAYLTAQDGGLSVFLARRSAVLHDQVATRTMLRQRIDKAVALERVKKENAAKLDSILTSARNQPPLPDVEQDDEGDQPGDSAKKADKPVKYYVFDDEDGDDKDKPKKRPRKQNAEYSLKKEPERPNFDATPIGNPARTGTVWTADRIATRFGYDPVFKLNLLAEARLRDQQGNHLITIGFRPYVDFRSSDTYIRYANLKHTIDYQFGVTRSGRFLHRAGLGARYNWTRLDANAVLPLSRYLSVGAGVHFAYINRKNVELMIPKDIDGNAFMTGGRVNLTYDKTENNGNFTTKGTLATFEVNNAYSLSKADNNFVTARMDLRKYVPIKRFVLATRLSGAWSQGPMQQQFFLGGTPDALLSRFYNPSDFPIESPNLPALHYMEFITPIRGFQFNGRNGTKYVAANAELRIPISRIFLNYLNSNPVYNIEFIPFFDFGTAWTKGNPLSQRNPIDTETINSYPLTITVQTLKSPFLMGFGAGARMQTFGYSMRFDLAWGVDDYTILNPRIHLSLGKNF